MKEIELTNGFVALVSDEDYDYLIQWDWFAAKSRKTYYATRKQSRDEYDRIENRKEIRMHRVIAERSGIDNSNLIDHVDRNGLNNQRDNLRPATRKQNAENTDLQTNNTSGYPGVVWLKRCKKWQVQIKNNGKMIYLGRFVDKQDAIKSRQDAEKKYFTHLSNLNQSV